MILTLLIMTGLGSGALIVCIPLRVPLTVRVPLLYPTPCVSQSVSSTLLVSLEDHNFSHTYEYVVHTKETY